MHCFQENKVQGRNSSDKTTSKFLNPSLEILMSSKNTRSSSHGCRVAQTITVERYFKMPTISLIPAEESARHRNNSAVNNMEPGCAAAVLLSIHNASQFHLLGWPFHFRLKKKTKHAVPKRYTACTHLNNPPPFQCAVSCHPCFSIRGANKPVRGHSGCVYLPRL